MPRINIEIPAELHAAAKAHPLLSISQLAKLGLEWAVKHYGEMYAPGAIGAATAPLTLAAQRALTGAPTGAPSLNPTSNPTQAPSPSLTGASSLTGAPSLAVSAPVAVSASASPLSADPVGDALRPWRDSRKHEWYLFEGFLTFLGLTRDAVLAYLDPEEDLDRNLQDCEVIDGPAIERLFVSLPGSMYASMDRYHAVNSWLEARMAASPNPVAA